MTRNDRYQFVAASVAPLLLALSVLGLFAVLGCQAPAESEQHSGLVEIEWVDFEDRAETRLYLHTDAGARISLAGVDASAVRSGDRVYVEGVVDGDSLAVESLVVEESVDRRRLARNGGPATERVLVVILDLEGSSRSPVDYNPTREEMESIAADIRQWYLDASYGQFTFELDVVGPYQTTSDSDARSLAASNDGVDLASYQRTLVVANFGSSWCGLANGIGGSSLKANTRCGQGAGVLKNSVHELGHALGLHHANYYACDVQKTAYDSCPVYEYSDATDVMGSARWYFNAPHREQLGWLAPGNVKRISREENGGGGTFTLETLDLPGSGLKVLRLDRGNGEDLVISFRRPVGFNAHGLQYMLEGAHIHLDDGDIRSRIIDPRPHPALDYASVQLPVGRPFVDARSGHRIEVLGYDDTTMTIAVDTPYGEPLVPLAEDIEMATLAGWSQPISGIVTAREPGTVLDTVSFDDATAAGEALMTPEGGRYTSPSDFEGLDRFSYTVTDTRGVDSERALVAVHVGAFENVGWRNVSAAQLDGDVLRADPGQTGTAQMAAFVRPHAFLRLPWQPGSRYEIALGGGSTLYIDQDYSGTGWGRASLGRGRGAVLGAGTLVVERQKNDVLVWQETASGYRKVLERRGLSLSTLGVVRVTFRESVPMPGLASFPGLDDTDRDGIANWRDNCTEVKNYEQADSDGDGYGDACDADFDNNGFVTTLDFGVFLQEFNSAEPSLCDHNGDGLVSGADFNIFMQYFGGVPGPSGLECAGTIPCTPWPQPANTPIASGTRPDR